MALSDEFAKLNELHLRGVLTDVEFSRAKARLLAGDDEDGDASVGSRTGALEALNTLRRSRGERWIAGICGGLAEATGVEPWVWRLLFALLLLFGGAGLVLYIVLWVFVPSE